MTPRVATVSVNGQRPDPGRLIRTVMLATDLGPASAAATEQAIAMAAQLGARLLVTSVVDPALPREERSRPRVDQVRAGREDGVQDVVHRARRRGVDTTFLVWEGPPGDAILNAAAAEDVDLIIVGSRGRGTVGRLLLGSVSDHVVRHAECPVLVVRNESERGRDVR
jgi:nucleotide-binding universal stress UspA family protein